MEDLSKLREEFSERIYKDARLENAEPTSKAEADANVILENLHEADGRNPCDETSEIFNDQFHLPPYYDEKLFKRGQDFFHKNMGALLFGKLLGLTTMLSGPSAAILSMTKQSSTPKTAYKRYAATFFHVLTWYQDDLKPGSKFWNSLKTVRSMHNAASKQGALKLKLPITQSDMTCTLFGFMGYAIIRGDKIGLYDVTKDELKAFIHFWRVIGYMLGIEDKFNICRQSVDETVVLCSILAEKLFKPLMENPFADFRELISAFYDGMKNVNPWTDTDVHIHYIHMVLENTDDMDLTKDCLSPLTKNQKSELRNQMYFITLFRFTVFRVMFNFFLFVCFKIIGIVMKFKK